jgi:hypothetical protein
LLRVLCAIPCLNEEVAIGSVVLRARRHAQEVVVVDDASTDRTAEVAELAGATVLRHAANGGKGKAYQTFWQHAVSNGVDALVTLDGDGQHDPEEIPRLLRVLQDGNDIAIGIRWGDSTGMPLWRRLGKRFLDYLSAWGGRSRGGPVLVTDSQSGFRAYGRRALERLSPQHAGFSVESQLLMDAQRQGLAIGEAPIHCRYDVDGSTQGAVRHASGVVNEILLQIGIEHPLLLIGLPGLAALALGMAMGAWSVYIYQSQGVFAIGWVLLSMLASILGILGLFAGILFNVLPRSLERALRLASPSPPLVPAPRRRAQAQEGPATAPPQAEGVPPPRGGQRAVMLKRRPG